MPNIFAEMLLVALRFAALWTVFYNLYRPKTKLRIVLAICLMVIEFPFCRILFFASGGNFSATVTVDTALFLIIAFICQSESQNKDSKKPTPIEGGLLRPVISALHFMSIVLLVNYIGSCYFFYFTGAGPTSFSLRSYFWKTIEGLINLLWSLFYYRVSRKMTAKTPISFSLLTILTPIAGLAVISASTRTTESLLNHGVNVFLYGGLFGTLIIVLNMSVFYLYVMLSVAHEALVFANNLAHTPPVWTPEHGLSSAFIEKYEITPREREVVEAMLVGKSDKEIAIKLNMAVNTVQVHLKRIYKKTGAAGRFALSALVRGGQ
jgi:DNA-binding CsgD family transcriptional regulator